MDEELHSLEQEFCPPLDPALIHALYPDYAGQPGGTQVLRGLLEGLTQTAAVEQLTAFDPSGSSGGAVRSSPSKQFDDADSSTETWTSQSQTNVTDSTSLSNGFATLELGPDSDNSAAGGYFRETEGYDTPTKEALLAETFPTLRFELVTYTLKKCGDDFEKATDELLNHVYFHNVRGSPEEEEVPIVKGIDAFSEEYHLPQRGKKGKKKKKRVDLYSVTSASNSESELSPTAPIANRWKDSGRDVEFLSSRTNVSAKTISSLYHANGVSLAGTIVAMMKKCIADHGKEEPDAPVIQPALELNDEFPNIELEYAIALIRLTAPSTAYAHELAKKLTVYPSAAYVAKGGLQVIPRYAPVNLSEPAPEITKLPDLAPSATPRTAASLSATRSLAFTNASAAYRKGRSNPLYKAAAGYYAQVGRDTNAHLRAQSEADAEIFVSQQSSSLVLDLHGVTVDSATRIAKQRTNAWWDGLGEAKIPGYGQGRGGARDGFRIVTGLGRHSEGGRGKIGPAVVRALVKEGWRVEVGNGELVVTGKAKRT
ncbi:hypothetical protein P171DRAFT_449304 [Karstenula rhodostoma CBS 690.94]|uniref:Smr domain-containing protein n=1 Tax=Karstenula rhodostoma CBS 690.94 TaxID=1392251 RepID=A0A9P4P495_9PLEO|nr:hypothetical protein P171DRAFT_449304 [Karstenula rhodostoma CBS 690.94]